MNKKLTLFICFCLLLAAPCLQQSTTLDETAMCWLKNEPCNESKSISSSTNGVMYQAKLDALAKLSRSGNSGNSGDDDDNNDSFFCNLPLESFDTLTQQVFDAKYARKSPVVIRRSEKQSNSDRNHIFQRECELDKLRDEYGDKVVTVSTANTHSYGRQSMRLRNYLAQYVKKTDDEKMKLRAGNETFYFFGENNHTEWKRLFDLYERPKLTLLGHSHAYSFGIAGKFTGVPFHFHGPGFAEALHGRKRWFFYAPNDKPKFDGDKSSLQWYLSEYEHLAESKRPLECVLRPLDVVYFPDRWWHATLNLDSYNVFMSTFLSPF